MKVKKYRNSFVRQLKQCKCQLHEQYAKRDDILSSMRKDRSRIYHCILQVLQQAQSKEVPACERNPNSLERIQIMNLFRCSKHKYHYFRELDIWKVLYSIKYSDNEQ